MNNQVYAVPKPKRKKGKKAVNNPPPSADDYCTYEGCNRNFAHLHECIGGRGKRQLSIKYGLQVRLCYEHHNMPNGDNPHFNKAIDTRLKQDAQRRFEAEIGSREEFVAIFSKNYL
jgi:hypothetical protein